MKNYGGIPLKEYEERLRNVRTRMKDRSIDFLLIFSEPSGLISNSHGYIRYLTNWSSVVPSFLILPLEGDPILFTSLTFEAKRAKEDTILHDIRTTGNFVKAASHIIKQQKASKIGLIGLGHDVSDNALSRGLLKEVPGVEFIIVSDILDKLRMIKSPAEIELIRKSCNISDLMFEILMDSVKTGEPVHLALAKMKFEGLKDGAEISECFVTGPNADYPRYHVHTNLRFEEGYQFTSATYANYNGYWSQEIRMGAIGKPSKTRKEAFETICQAEDTVFSMMKPGVFINDIVEEIFAVLSHAGYEAAIRVGHGIGLDYTEQYISDCFQHPGVKIKIPKIMVEKNMVFEIHPNVWTKSDEFSAIGDMILIKDTGVEVLTHFKRDLFQC